MYVFWGPCCVVRARKQGKWQYFFLCFDFGGGDWEGRGGTSARSLRKERRGKKIKTISLFPCRFPTVALPEPEGYPFARSFTFDLPCLQVALTQRFRFIHSLGRSLPRSPALLVLCVCVYDTVYPYPIPLAIFSFTFPPPPPSTFPLSLFPSSLPLTHLNLPNLPDFHSSPPPSLPSHPRRKRS